MLKRFNISIFFYTFILQNTFILYHKHFLNVFKFFETLCCYVLKVNSNTAIVNIIDNERFGANIVSLEELIKVTKVGIAFAKIIF